ncbi:MAG: hypothetical protein P4L99_03090 [Chthoniobacter sp.]|nr:hypothetical protein [Chthoniobacter sp.]
MKAPATEANLTFAIPDDSGFPYLLFFCVLGSLLAHAGTFFLFQVVYPQRVTIPQPAPHVSLLTPSSPENIALLRWIEAEDPALVANDNPVAPPGLVDVQYHPSFASPRTAPLGAPVEAAPAVRFPPAVDTLSPTSRSQPAPRTPAAIPAQGTSIVYSGTLSDRSLTKNPPLATPYRASAPAEPTTLLIGVDGQGAVRFSIVQHPSGDQGLDEMAAAHLKNVTFAASEAPITWGFATFSWGGDAYASASKVP